MYLKARESIVLNYNPFIAFKEDPDPAQMNQVNKILEYFDIVEIILFANEIRLLEQQTF